MSCDSVHPPPSSARLRNRSVLGAQPYLRLESCSGTCLQDSRQVGGWPLRRDVIVRPTARMMMARGILVPEVEWALVGPEQEEAA